MHSEQIDIQHGLRNSIAANAEVTMGLLEPILPEIERAADAITQCFLKDGKLITAGVAANAAIADYCVAIFADRLERERPGLPAISLSGNSVLSQSIAHTISQHEVTARQLRSIALDEDCLLMFGPCGDSAAGVQAISAAHDRNIQIIAVTGLGDSDLSSLLTPEDIELHIESASLTRMAEAQLFISHCLCEAVETFLFGQDSQ